MQQVLGWDSGARVADFDRRHILVTPGLDGDLASLRRGCNRVGQQIIEDLGGLYLSPPEHAIVLCADEKSQIQALDRTQPGLPLKKGRCGTMTHDYKRNGTATLFAAMSTLDGTVISMWTTGTCASPLFRPLVPN
jgi:hypothetical protein